MTNKNEEIEEVEIANDLSFFMPGKAETVEEIKIPISSRFKDAKGEIIPFVFKAITTARVDELEELSTESIIKKNRKVGEKVNQARFIAHIAVESTVYPNFKSAEFRKAYKTEDAVEIAKKVLNVAGEYANWLNKANEINGFNDTPEDLEEAAKN